MAAGCGGRVVVAPGRCRWACRPAHEPVVGAARRVPRSQGTSTALPCRAGSVHRRASIHHRDGPSMGRVEGGGPRGCGDRSRRAASPRPVELVSLRSAALARRNPPRPGVGGPAIVADDDGTAQSVLRHAHEVPALTWGRQVPPTRDMWNSNSLVSWLLRVSGVPIADLSPPSGGRAPGWGAGLALITPSAPTS